MKMRPFLRPFGSASRRTLAGLYLTAATLLASPILTSAQSQAPSDATQPSGSSAPAHVPQPGASGATQPKPAKIWTNEDIGELHNKNSVSVVGQKPSTRKVSATSTSISQAQNVTWYKNQLVPLREDIERLGPQITRLQAFLSGENISDTPTMHRQLVPSPLEQLKQLEAKRAADQVKIEDLLDRARKNGIEPGALR